MTYLPYGTLILIALLLAGSHYQALRIWAGVVVFALALTGIEVSRGWPTYFAPFPDKGLVVAAYDGKYLVVTEKLGDTPRLYRKDYDESIETVLEKIGIFGYDRGDSDGGDLFGMADRTDLEAFIDGKEWR